MEAAGDRPHRRRRERVDANERAAEGLLVGFIVFAVEPEDVQRRRQAFDQLAKEFDARVVARAVMQDLTPRRYTEAIRCLPSVGPHALDGIPLLALADAALVFGCRVEIKFVPEAQEPPVENSIVTVLSSIFSTPCGDPTCSCQATRTHAADSVDEAHSQTEAEVQDVMAGADAHLESDYEDRAGVEDED